MSFYLKNGEKYNEINKSETFFFQASEQEAHEYYKAVQVHISQFYNLNKVSVRFEGINNLFFDPLLRRFVDIIIDRDFSYEYYLEKYLEKLFALKDFVDESFLKQFNLKYDSTITKEDLDLNIYKMVVVSSSINTVELIKYYTKKHHIGEVELWKVTHFEGGSFAIEELDNKKPNFLKFHEYGVHGEPKFRNATNRLVEEELFFQKGRLSIDVKRKYYQLIDFLRYYFKCELEIYRGSDGLDMLTYDELKGSYLVDSNSNSLEENELTDAEFETVDFIIVNVINVQDSYDLRLALYIKENQISTGLYILVREAINRFKNITNHYSAAQFHYPFKIGDLMISEYTNIADFITLFESAHSRFLALESQMLELKENMESENKNHQRFNHGDEQSLPF